MIRITYLTLAATLIGSGALSGCETLSDPDFLSALQQANVQLQTNLQPQQELSSCLQSSAGNRAASNQCLTNYDLHPVTSQ
jgi:hypothetical protein